MVNFDNGMRLAEEFYQEVADETRLAWDIARTFLEMRSRKVGRILQSRTAGNGRLYAFSVKKHVLVLILFVGKDTLYGGFAHGMDDQWQRVFFGLKELLDNEAPIFPLREESAKVDSEYGRQIPCPEFEALGFRIFVTGGLTWQQWTMWLWPENEDRPLYEPYFRREYAHMSNQAGLLAFIRELAETYRRNPQPAGYLMAAEAVILRLSGKEANNAS